MPESRFVGRLHLLPHAGSSSSSKNIAGEQEAEAVQVVGAASAHAMVVEMAVAFVAAVVAKVAAVTDVVVVVVLVVDAIVK